MLEIMTFRKENEMNEFIKRVEDANAWDEIEPEEYIKELEIVGLNYYDYDDPDVMWEEYLNAIQVLNS